MAYHQFWSNNYTKMLYLLLILLPSIAMADSSCEDKAHQQHNRTQSLKFKKAAIASILVAGGIGVSLPQLGRKIEALNPESDKFFMIKAFAAGVILATGFVHILPDAFDSLTSPCLKENPWRKFPFTGFIAMMSAIGTLMIDSLASGFYKRSHFKKSNQVVMDEEQTANDENIHNHAARGHAHGPAAIPPQDDQHTLQPDLIRHRIISQVLEWGIIVHSVIIGVTLGASESPATVKTLMAALSFHQCFEGLGLGGCISQAKFKSLHTIIMAAFFSFTTPVGIGIGIGISSVYSENTPTALIVQGILNSASAGILIYMALVDLLAADFMETRMQSNLRLLLAANISLLLGAGCMSVLAKWA